MSKKYYIAYGSNLNVRQMLHRCPEARIVGTAVLDGWQLMFKGSKTGSYLTIEERPGAKTPVAIWEITETDEIALDRYEGYPSFYYKRNLPISFTGIRSGKVRNREAMVYIMHEDRPFGLPTHFYVDTCAEGYHYFDFDINVLTDAINYSFKEIKK